MMVLATGGALIGLGVTLLLSSSQTRPSAAAYPFGAIAYLSLGDYCQFETSSCIPVTWLALFATGDWAVESRHRGPYEYTAVLYKTLRTEALQRVEAAIERATKYPSVWAYLRPLEVLRDELERCPPGARVELHATEVWEGSEAIRKQVRSGAADLAAMLEGLSGEGEENVASLSLLVDGLGYAAIRSLAELDAEARMLVLIGAYWGDPEREELYSRGCFSEDYWSEERQ